MDELRLCCVDPSSLLLSSMSMKKPWPTLCESCLLPAKGRRPSTPLDSTLSWSNLTGESLYSPRSGSATSYDSGACRWLGLYVCELDLCRSGNLPSV